MYVIDTFYFQLSIISTFKESQVEKISFFPVKSASCYRDDRLQLDTKEQFVINDSAFIGKSFGLERTKLGKGNEYDFDHIFPFRKFKIRQ